MKVLLWALVTISATIQYSKSRIINPKPKRLYIKKFWPAPARSLKLKPIISKEVNSADYTFNDKIIETRNEFFRKIGKPNLIPSNIGSRVLEAPDISKDWIEKVMEGVKVGCSSSGCQAKPDQSFILLSDKEGNAVAKFTMNKRESKDKDDHNVTIKVDNYELKSEFEEKRMKGLAIIEADEAHREEIVDFTNSAIQEFMGEDEASAEETNLLASLGDQLGKIVTKNKLTPVVEDPEKGFMFQRKNAEGFYEVIAFAYEIIPGVLEAKVMTHTMDELSMQFRGAIDEDEIKSLTDQITELLGKTDKIVAPTLDSVLKNLSGLAKSVGKHPKSNIMSNACNGADFAKAESVPNTIFLRFTLDVPEEEKNTKHCVLRVSYVTMMNLMDMPYLFFSFSNERMMAEHFIPAIEDKVTQEKLTKAWNDVLDLNASIEEAINENKDTNNELIENPSTYEVEDLIQTVSEKAKAAGLASVPPNATELPIAFNDKDGNLRINMEETDEGARVSLLLPHKAFKSFKN